MSDSIIPAVSGQGWTSLDKVRHKPNGEVADEEPITAEAPPKELAYREAPSLDNQPFYESFLAFGKMAFRTTSFQTIEKDQRHREAESLVEVRDYLQTLKGADTFFTRNVAQFPVKRPTGVPNIEDITGYTSIWLDFDLEKGHRLPEKWAVPPTWIVQTSPRGYHVYWLFSEPEKDLEGAKRLQTALSEHYGSDQGLNDHARIVRAPGSQNAKPGKQLFQVRVVDHQDSVPTARYSLQGLKEQFGLAWLDYQHRQWLLEAEREDIDAKRRAMTNGKPPDKERVLEGVLEVFRQGILDRSTGKKEGSVNIYLYGGTRNFVHYLQELGMEEEELVQEFLTVARAAVKQGGRSDISESEVERQVKNGVRTGLEDAPEVWVSPEVEGGASKCADEDYCKAIEKWQKIESPFEKQRSKKKLMELLGVSNDKDFRELLREVEEYQLFTKNQFSYSLAELESLNDEQGGMFLIPPILIAHAVAVLGGDSGLGKSMLMYPILRAVVTGGYLERDTTTGLKATGGGRHVILIQTDESIPVMVKRLRSLDLSDEELQRVHIVPIFNTAAKGYKELKKLVEQFDPVLIIADCLSSIAGERIREENDAVYGSLLHQMRQFCGPNGPAWLLTHHSRKLTHGETSIGVGSSALRGSGSIKAAADVVLMLHKGPTPDTRILIPEKRIAEGRYMYTIGEDWMTPEIHNFVEVDKTTSSPLDVSDSTALRDILRKSMCKQSVTALRKQFPMGHTFTSTKDKSIYKVLDRLVAQGHIFKKDGLYWDPSVGNPRFENKFLEEKCLLSPDQEEESLCSKDLMVVDILVDMSTKQEEPKEVDKVVDTGFENAACLPLESCFGGGVPAVVDTVVDTGKNGMSTRQIRSNVTSLVLGEAARQTPFPENLSNPNLPF